MKKTIRGCNTPDISGPRIAKGANESKVGGSAPGAGLAEEFEMDEQATLDQMTSWPHAPIGRPTRKAVSVFDRPHPNGLLATRGLLALIVCFGHAWQTFQTPARGQTDVILYVLGFLARIAVVLFFTLSGWIIANTVNNDLAVGRLRFTRYVSNRLHRILPPLFVSVALCSVIGLNPKKYSLEGYAMARPNIEYNVVDFLKSLFSFGLRGDFTGGMNGPLWSLIVEIQFYTLVAIVASIFRVQWVPLALVMSAFLLAHFQSLGFGHPAIIGYFGFVAGYVSNTFLGRSAMRARQIALGLQVGILPLSVVAILVDRRLFDLEHGFLFGVQIFSAVVFSIAIPFVDQFRSKFLACDIGEYSYSLYIFHFPIFLLLSFEFYQNVNPTRANRIAAVLVSFAATCVSCLALGRKIERAEALKFFSKNQWNRFMQAIRKFFPTGASQN
jgi:peptidoglycan/LPS O-acetylase OafA/YrhL